MFFKNLIFNCVLFYVYGVVSQKSTDFWNEMEPFGQSGPPAVDLRLPPYIVPSYYRLKLKADVKKSLFSGEVYITLRATKRVQEIILHAKNLTINNNAKLTEQIYENLEAINERSRRSIPENTTYSLENETSIEGNLTSETNINFDNTADFKGNITETPATVPDTQVTHSNVRSVKIISITESTGDRLILTLASALTPDTDYILELSFEGQILNSLTGFYKSSYVNNNNEVRQLGVTQFEPTSARAAFPCFDEPSFKAKFEISIAHPKTISVLSNMKVTTQESMPEDPAWQWTHFDRSVRMSTYLVAFVLSDFRSAETTYTGKDNVTKTIKIWTRPELIAKANYALSITPKLLAYYEDVFGVPYALDKLDLIAIPDFSSGAMENWGLITFRETTLLFDEKESVPRDKQNVAVDVAHELAHQWFGNLVTMAWWTDLWLNEGFATYVEYLGVDKIEPEWKMFESFTRDKMELLRADALRSTSPVSRRAVDAAEIAQKFDEISYTKAANLIRMLNHTISEELFHKGLASYLRKWMYQNAEENDLWEAMSEVVRTRPGLGGLSVATFMNSWTRQAGYPVVSVQRNYDTGLVTFQQKLFTSAPDPYPSMAEQMWSVPISFTAIDDPVTNWSASPKLWLNDRTAVANIPLNDTEALYVNVDAIGYYRVNYDKRNWQLLGEALRSGRVASPLVKAQLIDDAFNLAKAGQLDYQYALELTTCVIDGEDSKVVWDMVLNNMAFLNTNLKSTDGYVYFQDYMRLILAKQLAKINYGLVQSADDNEAFLAENLVLWECLVESPRCLHWARGEFDKWASRGDPSDNPIPSYMRAVVYTTALKFGGREEYEFLWRQFLNSSDPAVQSLTLSVLPATRQEYLVTFLLEKSVTDLPKQYASMAWGVEPPVGTRVAQDYLIDNFDLVHERLTNIDSFSLTNALNGAFGVMTSAHELKRFKTFALSHKDKLMPISQSLQKIVDSASMRIAWTSKHARGVNLWFREYVMKNAPANAFFATEHPATETVAEVTTHAPTDVNATDAPLDDNTTDLPFTTTYASQ